ncbi:MAG: hypothetical protein MJ252_01705 [archaeon]|nr:hypothetical protein [archaeon]
MSKIVEEFQKLYKKVTSSTKRHNSSQMVDLLTKIDKYAKAKIEPKADPKQTVENFDFFYEIEPFRQDDFIILEITCRLAKLKVLSEKYKNEMIELLLTKKFENVFGLTILEKLTNSCNDIDPKYYSSIVEFLVFNCLLNSNEIIFKRTYTLLDNLFSTPEKIDQFLYEMLLKVFLQLGFYFNSKCTNPANKDNESVFKATLNVIKLYLESSKINQLIQRSTFIKLCLAYLFLNSDKSMGIIKEFAENDTDKFINIFKAFFVNDKIYNSVNSSYYIFNEDTSMRIVINNPNRYKHFITKRILTQEDKNLKKQYLDNYTELKNKVDLDQILSNFDVQMKKGAFIFLQIIWGTKKDNNSNIIQEENKEEEKEKEAEINNSPKEEEKKDENNTLNNIINIENERTSKEKSEEKKEEAKETSNRNSKITSRNSNEENLSLYEKIKGYNNILLLKIYDLIIVKNFVYKDEILSCLSSLIETHGEELTKVEWNIINKILNQLIEQPYFFDLQQILLIIHSLILENKFNGSISEIKKVFLNYKGIFSKTVLLNYQINLLFEDSSHFYISYEQIYDSFLKKYIDFPRSFAYFLELTTEHYKRANICQGNEKIKKKLNLIERVIENNHQRTLDQYASSYKVINYYSECLSEILSNTTNQLFFMGIVNLLSESVINNNQNNYNNSINDFFINTIGLIMHKVNLKRDSEKMNYLMTSLLELEKNKNMNLIYCVLRILSKGEVNSDYEFDFSRFSKNIKNYSDYISLEDEDTSFNNFNSFPILVANYDPQKSDIKPKKLNKAYAPFIVINNKIIFDNLFKIADDKKLIKTDILDFTYKYFNHCLKEIYGIESMDCFNIIEYLLSNDNFNWEKPNQSMNEDLLEIFINLVYHINLNMINPNIKYKNDYHMKFYSHNKEQIEILPKKLMEKLISLFECTMKKASMIISNSRKSSVAANTQIGKAEIETKLVGLKHNVFFDNIYKSLKCLKIYFNSLIEEFNKNNSLDSILKRDNFNVDLELGIINDTNNYGSPNPNTHRHTNAIHSNLHKNITLATPVTRGNTIIGITQNNLNSPSNTNSTIPEKDSSLESENTSNQKEKEAEIKQNFTQESFEKILKNIINTISLCGLKSVYTFSLISFIFESRNMIIALGDKSIVKIIVILFCLAFPNYYSEDINNIFESYYDDKFISKMDYIIFLKCFNREGLKHSSQIKRKLVKRFALFTCLYFMEHLNTSHFLYKVLTKIFIDQKDLRDFIFFNIANFCLSSKSTRDNFPFDKLKNYDENSLQIFAKKDSILLFNTNQNADDNSFISHAAKRAGKNLQENMEINNVDVYLYNFCCNLKYSFDIKKGLKEEKDIEDDSFISYQKNVSKENHFNLIKEIKRSKSQKIRNLKNKKIINDIKNKNSKLFQTILSLTHGYDKANYVFLSSNKIKQNKSILEKILSLDQYPALFNFTCGLMYYPNSNYITFEDMLNNTTDIPVSEEYLLFINRLGLVEKAGREIIDIQQNKETKNKKEEEEKKDEENKKEEENKKDEEEKNTETDLESSFSESDENENYLIKYKDSQSQIIFYSSELIKSSDNSSKINKLIADQLKKDLLQNYIFMIWMDNPFRDFDVNFFKSQIKQDSIFIVIFPITNTHYKIEIVPSIKEDSLTKIIKKVFSLNYTLNITSENSIMYLLDLIMELNLFITELQFKNKGKETNDSSIINIRRQSTSVIKLKSGEDIKSKKSDLDNKEKDKEKEKESSGKDQKTSFTYFYKKRYQIMSDINKILFTHKKHHKDKDKEKDKE